MDEVRNPGIATRAGSVDRVSAPSERRRLLAGAGVVIAILAIAVGVTFYIWRGVGAPAPAASAQVQEIERLLDELGFAPGVVDGVFDAQTEAAIRSFQQVAGMTEDGAATPGLLDELRAVAGGQ